MANIVQQMNAQIREAIEKTFQVLRAADITIDKVKQGLQDDLMETNTEDKKMRPDRKDAWKPSPTTKKKKSNEED